MKIILYANVQNNIYYGEKMQLMQFKEYFNPTFFFAHTDLIFIISVMNTEKNSTENILTRE